MNDNQKLDRLAEALAESQELYEWFCDVVHDASSEAASNAINNADGITWLMTLGWSADDIERALIVKMED